VETSLDQVAFAAIAGCDTGAPLAAAWFCGGADRSCVVVAGGASLGGGWATGRAAAFASSHSRWAGFRALVRRQTLPRVDHGSPRQIEAAFPELRSCLPRGHRTAPRSA